MNSLLEKLLVGPFLTSLNSIRFLTIGPCLALMTEISHMSFLDYITEPAELEACAAFWSQSLFRV